MEIRCERHKLSGWSTAVYRLTHSRFTYLGVHLHGLVGHSNPCGVRGGSTLKAHPTVATHNSRVSAYHRRHLAARSRALFALAQAKQKNRGVNEIWTDAVQRAALNASKGVAPKALSGNLVRMGDLGNVPRQEKKFKVCAPSTRCLLVCIERHSASFLCSMHTALDQSKLRLRCHAQTINIPLPSFFFWRVGVWTFFFPSTYASLHCIFHGGNKKEIVRKMLRKTLTTTSLGGCRQYLL